MPVYEQYQYDAIYTFLKETGFFAAFNTAKMNKERSYSWMCEKPKSRSRRANYNEAYGIMKGYIESLQAIFELSNNQINTMIIRSQQNLEHKNRFTAFTDYCETLIDTEVITDD